MGLVFFQPVIVRIVRLGKRSLHEEISMTQGAGTFCILGWLTTCCGGVFSIAVTIDTVVLRAFVYIS